MASQTLSAKEEENKSERGSERGNDIERGSENYKE